MSKDDGDYLGYGVYAKTLWDRIARALNKDAAGGTLGDDPLVVGIFGEWGSGKSKLLSMVMQRAVAERDERISVHKHDGYAPLTIPVFFQPWKYEHEKHLLVPMLLHIVLALEDCLKRAKTLDDALVGTVRRGIDGALQQIGGVVKATKTVLGVVEPGSAAALGTAQALADTIKLGTPRKQVRDFTWREDGRAYYELHDILRKVTRPGKYAEVTGGAYQDKDFGCNFVIFIDDLDRCLPEKAVEALELIKTVFNLESFAFVLALDEEVVERGIGHRYKDYALQNKKPEMPITGFEYLEKIVHLPFRLPALTRAEGLEFLRQYEDQFLKQRVGDRQAWFTDRVQAQALVATKAGRDELEERRGFKAGYGSGESVAPGAMPVDWSAAHLHLGHLVVNSFSAHVPRKLVRIVELFHQTLDVLQEREKEPGRSRLDQMALGSKLDPRLLLAFILLQLFHPDLYRACRRSGVGFDALRDAHVSGELHPDLADVDLMHWAAFADGNEPPRDRPALHRRLVALKDRDGQRGPAERVRLPLLNCLLDHRAAQRHAFNPLRLFYALARSAEVVPLESGSSGHYFALLAAQPLLAAADSPWLDVVWPSARDAGSPQVGTSAGDGQPSDAGTRPVASSPGPQIDVRALYSALISAEEREQESVVVLAGLQQGEALPAPVARELLALLDKWLKSFKGDAVAEPRQRLLRGLRYFAPHVPRSFAPAFWDLVKDADHGGELGKPIKDIEQLAARELWADVRSTLGADPRWEASRRHLPSARFAAHDEKVEPIPGFVRIPAGSFIVGADDQNDNKPRTVRIASDFFIARHLTTVDQFAAFIAAKGYENDDWWDSQGTAWRKGGWASKTNDENLRKWLDERTPEQRQQPIAWAEQQAHGSRPVWGVNWFEARAYARWLSAQLVEDLDKATLAGYQVCLPTEAQWERAARAASLGQADKRLWPWGDDEKSAPLRANIDDSKIGHASVVGLFEPNPLGLADLSGNLWEWQDNLYEGKGNYKAWERIPPITGHLSGAQEPPDWLLTEEDRQKSALPALRGGSWISTADNARAPIRDGVLPDFAGLNFGFRLVLSLAE